jgi:fructose/tagatose bisphosphate aldolase
MLAEPDARPTDLVERVAALATLTHAHGAAIEGELGELPMGVTGTDHPSCGGSLTDPDDAAAFVAATGVDLLAVSVGNIHIQLHGECSLDLDRLERIHRRVSVPLVLHGGTGIAAHSLRAAIKRGVAKVNFGTYLKRRYLAAVREAVSPEIDDPHRLFGIGGSEDVLAAGRLAVKNAVLERIDHLGCCGRAGGARDPS